MTGADSERLRALRDREQIRDVLMRYAHGVDHRDLEMVRGCFTSDAEYRGALAETNVEDALARLRTSLSRYAATMHFIAQQTIVLDGDRATSEAYAIAYHREHLADGERDLVLGVRYRDALVRDGATWRIHRREAICDWQRRDALRQP